MAAHNPDIREFLTEDLQIKYASIARNNKRDAAKIHKK